MKCAVMVLCLVAALAQHAAGTECWHATAGITYDGAMNVTADGQACLRWDLLPAQHLLRHLHDQHNYCRESVPPTLSQPGSQPWCYTSQGGHLTRPNEWSFGHCAVPICDFDCWRKGCLYSDSSRNVMDVHVYHTSCGWAAARYLGKVDRTVSGLTCQRWDVQEPHAHTYSALADHENFCRNPSKSSKPWCYTTANHTRWEHCSIDKCGDNDKVECDGEFVQGVQYLMTNYITVDEPTTNQECYTACKLAPDCLYWTYYMEKTSLKGERGNCTLGSSVWAFWKGMDNYWGGTFCHKKTTGGYSAQ